MNEEAQRAIETLKQIRFTSTIVWEQNIFPDLKDFLNNPTKSNAAALFEKLQQEVDKSEENPERRDKATRQVLLMLLSPYVDQYTTTHALYSFRGWRNILCLPESE